MGKSKSKSPLKDNPLRNPGQSLDEEIQHKLDEQALPWIIAFVMSIVFAVLEAMVTSFVLSDSPNSVRTPDLV